MAVYRSEQSSAGTLEDDDRYPGRSARWTGILGDAGLHGPPLVGRSAGLRLGRAVEAEIVPRLLLGHRKAPPRVGSSRTWIAAPTQIEELAGCAVGHAEAAADYVASLRASGAKVEDVYLDLLGPAACHLGDLWSDDRLSFVDVTIGLLRLHQVLRALAPEFRAEAAAARPGRRALLVPAPGEQHSFGLAMVTEFFRRAGWGVWSGVPRSLEEILDLARGEWFGVIGFSLASETRLEALATCIRRVRGVSRNPTIGVMVGGPIFAAHPDLAAAVGADATAQDGRHAAFQAEGLLALQSTIR